eukprot:s178_g21.t1
MEEEESSSMAATRNLLKAWSVWQRSGIAHWDRELAVEVATKLCFQFMSKGRCNKGSQCTFAHGKKELRQMPAGQLPSENQRKTSRLAKFEPMKINTQMAKEANAAALAAPALPSAVPMVAASSLSAPPSPLSPAGPGSASQMRAVQSKLEQLVLSSSGSGNSLLLPFRPPPGLAPPPSPASICSPCSPLSPKSAGRTTALWPLSMGEATKEVIFGRFRRVATSFRVAGVALRDIPTCFKTCRKSFCVAGAILSRRFQKLTYPFRGRRSTLDTSIVIFRGRRSTLDVSCCVFFANRIVRAASRGAAVQIVWQAWHFLTCDVETPLSMGEAAKVMLYEMKSDGSLARNACFRLSHLSSLDSVTFLWSAILLRRVQKLTYVFRGRRSTLDTSIVIFRGRRSTLDVSYCVFFANRIVRATSSGENVQIVWQEWHFLTGDVEAPLSMGEAAKAMLFWTIQMCRNVAVYAGSCKK